MDLESRELDTLLAETDFAFKQVMQNPDSGELNAAYDAAKRELDSYLANMKTSLKKRYKNF